MHERPFPQSAQIICFVVNSSLSSFPHTCFGAMVLRGLLLRSSRNLVYTGAFAAASGGSFAFTGMNNRIFCDEASKDKFQAAQFKMPALSPEDLGPFAGSVSVGTLLGFCSGFAVKKTGKAAAFVVGCLFCLQQSLSYAGYITVNWKKVEDDLTKLLDTNNDGTLDMTDANAHYFKMLEILQHNTYSLSAGFGGGFLYGVKKG
mmetsp:Transcript_87389/g.182876  ORF Transcript_87389/g.182876 Transcript_87389/m.182876 type:complete len:203 (+) Transcript_87389:35-643(+)|eukprot:CAMPEP_0206471264 /NCGR_PEP_ID=MMETSP0324_2-20121206/31447_1 /ASSEMBLY_ACC=CAM_ASM_000836 /TAXON_ID=2866 /ORGANISM="Crypthecodinium cohnii, Strain Seligo" /LENGTH=202 /DNA_ID=CAMNT_0053945531 /DNA_START=20 /DNA_END=628 /DNA_ORIENTATION=-